MFRQRGYYGSTLELIARSARIPKSNLYYYFKDKREILYAFHNYATDFFLETIEKVKITSDSPVEQLHELLASFIANSLIELHGAVLNTTLEALSVAQRRKIIAKRDRVEKAIRHIVQTGMERGVFQPGDPKLVTFAMLGAVSWIPIWFKPRGSSSPAEIARTFADYLTPKILYQSGDEHEGGGVSEAGDSFLPSNRQIA